MKYAYPVTTPECHKPVKAYMQGYEEAFSSLRKAGYQGVELLLRDPAAIDTGELEAALLTHGLKLAAVGTSPMQVEDRLFLLHPDEQNRKEARRRCSGLLRLCARFQVPALIGKYRGQVSDLPHCTEASLKAIMKDICAEAESLGVPVLLEPQNTSNINNLNTIDEGLAWISEIGYGRLGLLADVYHMGITEPSIVDSLKKGLGRIGFIHMSDSGRRIPGEGGLPVREVMRLLEAEAYPGFISLEIEQVPDSRTAAQRSIACLRSCLKGGADGF